MTARRWRAPAALLCGMALVVLAACGDDGAKTATDGSSTTSTSAAVETSTTHGGLDTTTTKAAAVLTLTPDAYGAVRVGMTFAQAKAKGLIGDVGVGCEVASPPTKGARLVGPMEGAVYGLEDTITAIDVDSRFLTSPGGIQQGDSLTQLQAAFAGYDVQVDKSTEDVFQIWVVDVVDGGHQLFAFTVDPETQTVRTAAVPSVSFCD